MIDAPSKRGAAARSLWDEGREADALELFREAIRQEPNNVRCYVMAARAIGIRIPRLIVRHMLPNIMGPVIVLATLGIGGIIILEAALSFIGLGVQPPTASWGRALSDARPHIMRYTHTVIAPGVMITLTVLAFNMIGDGLRDALDPRQRD
jgi:peptide/nickel transport system permease protein